MGLAENKMAYLETVVAQVTQKEDVRLADAEQLLLVVRCVPEIAKKSITMVTECWASRLSHVERLRKAVNRWQQGGGE